MKLSLQDRLLRHGTLLRAVEEEKFGSQFSSALPVGKLFLLPFTPEQLTYLQKYIYASVRQLTGREKSTLPASTIRLHYKNSLENRSANGLNHT